MLGRSLKNMESQPNSKAEMESLNCATANIVESRSYGLDDEIRLGTKHFSGGAKVHIVDAFRGTCTDATVVGHHRKSGRYIKVTMRVRHLENLRITSVYSPKVIEVFKEHYAAYGSDYYLKHDAEHLCSAVAEWSKTEKGENKAQ